METYEKDGKVYNAQEYGHRCELCNAYMDMYYNEEHGWIDPHDYDGFGDNTCHKCSQEYMYEEGLIMVLSKEQLDALRKLKGVNHAN